MHSSKDEISTNIPTEIIVLLTWVLFQTSGKLLEFPVFMK